MYQKVEEWIEYAWELDTEFLASTVDSRYSSSLKYGHLDIPAIWLGTEC